MKKFLLILIGAILLSGCQLTDAPMWLNAAENHTVSTSQLTHSATSGAQKNPPIQPTKVTSLYQNPAVDAEIAASVKDFRLLGYQTQPSAYVTPAVPDHYTQMNIKQGCGIRLLPGAASTVSASFDDKQRQSIRHYIERYNRIMLRYCESNAGKSLRVAYRQPG